MSCTTCGNMTGGGMTGCPMMGGDGGGWSMPSGMTPDAYHAGMAAPSPSLHSASEWSAVAARTRVHMQDAGGAGQGVKIPTAGEFDTIVDYLGQHAH